jgi:hypothetical protein
MRKMTSLTLACATFASLAATPAAADCAIERAIYEDMEGAARIEFFATGTAATVTNSFRMLLDDTIVLDGIVQWTDEVPRPNGKLMYQCPDGDVTGPEYEICTVWQGVIYTADETGNIGLLPAEGVGAPAKLIFPDLGHALRMSSAYGATGFTKTPWDVFQQKGCQ